MSLRTGYDAAYPPPVPPATDVVLFYCGGDTPHVWTRAEIEAQRARWRLPIFVRSDPAPSMAPADAAAMLARLADIGCPKHVATVLDIETAITRPYVLRYGQEMHRAGYQVLVYGSRSTLPANPQLDGWFVATWGRAPTLAAGWAALQYEALPNWDLDVITSRVPLWDTVAVPTRGSGSGSRRRLTDMFIARTTVTGKCYLTFGNATCKYIETPGQLGALEGAVPTAEFPTETAFTHFVTGLQQIPS